MPTPAVFAWSVDPVEVSINASCRATQTEVRINYDLDIQCVDYPIPIKIVGGRCKSQRLIDRTLGGLKPTPPRRIGACGGAGFSRIVAKMANVRLL
jgi:hypothetical protein